MKKRTLGLAMCGSFCTFSRVLDAFETLEWSFMSWYPSCRRPALEPTAASVCGAVPGAAGNAVRTRDRPYNKRSRAVRPKKASGRASSSCRAPATRLQSWPQASPVSGHAGGKGTFAERASRDRRRVDQRRSGRKRGKSRHAFEPTRILFLSPSDRTQRVQKAALPRRGFHKAAADRRTELRGEQVQPIPYGTPVG